MPKKLSIIPGNRVSVLSEGTVEGGAWTVISKQIEGFYLVKFSSENGPIQIGPVDESILTPIGPRAKRKAKTTLGKDNVSY